MDVWCDTDGAWAAKSIKNKANRGRVAVLEGAAGSPPFQGELMLMLIGYFGLTLLHAQKEGSYV